MSDEPRRPEFVRGEVVSLKHHGEKRYELVVDSGNGMHLMQPFYLEPSDKEGDWRFASRHTIEKSGMERVKYDLETTVELGGSPLGSDMAALLKANPDLKKYVTLKL